jgi:hypothetical protein
MLKVLYFKIIQLFTGENVKKILNFFLIYESFTNYLINNFSKSSIPDKINNS